MATLEEIHDIITTTVAGAQDLRNKVRAQGVVTSAVVLNGNDTTDPPYDQTAGKHDDRVRLAAQILGGNAIQALFEAVVGANDTATQTQILNATDSAIETNVEDMFDEVALAVKQQLLGT